MLTLNLLRNWSSWRRAGSKTQPHLPLPPLVRGNLRVHLVRVIAAFSQRLTTALEARLDLLDFGARVLLRIDPVPLGRQPVAAEVVAAPLLVIGQRQGA